MSPTRSLAGLVFGFLAACSVAGGGGGGGGGLVFHGEADVIPGFSYDTGLQPSGSPVQVQLQVSATGKTTVDATADHGGSSVVGRVGSGKLTVDGHFKLAGNLKVDISGVKYDGAIPDLTNVDIAFGGTTAFDPFLLAGAPPASVTANVPPTDLPPIPLPGGLTGTLVLSIAPGSTVTSTFAGTCAGISNGKVQYLGQTGATGSLHVAAKVIVKVPIVGDKTFDLPSVTIPLPTDKHALDLGTLDIGSSGDAPTGSPAATATQGSCGSNTTTDGGTVSPDAGQAADGNTPSGPIYVSHGDVAWTGAEAFYFASVGSPGDCQDQCNKIAGCLAYVTDGTQCGGISSFTEPVAYTGAISWIRGDLALAYYESEIQIDHEGSDIASQIGMDPSSCAEWCKATNGCVGFTLSTNPIDQGTCWLKSAWGASTVNSERYSFCPSTTPGCNGQ